MSDKDEDGYVWNIFWLVMLFIWFVVPATFQGNYWCTRDGVLGRIRAENPQVAEILFINRHVLERSEVVCLTDERQKTTYWADCNILFGCKLFNKSEKQEKAEAEEAEAAAKRAKKKWFFFF